MRADETSLGGPDGPFPTTAWTEILAAGGAAPAPLADVLRRYWRPVYAYVRADWGKSIEDAKDLTQAFFVHLLERGDLARVRPDRGRFRSYLRRALKSFLIDAKRAAGAQRRRVPAGRLDLTDEELAAIGPASPAEPPDRAFAREWLHGVLEEAIEELRVALGRKGRETAFAVFHCYCLEGSEVTYAEVGRRLGLGETEVRHALEEARVLLRALVRRRVPDSEVAGS